MQSDFNLSSVSSSVPSAESTAAASVASTEAAPPKRDFSNPMYDAMGNMESEAEAAAATAAAVPPAAASMEPPPLDPSGPFDEPPSAVIAPSSVIQKSSPKMKKKPREMGASRVDTGKDTQCLVEEGEDEIEDSEC